MIHDSGRDVGAPRARESRGQWPIADDSADRERAVGIAGSVDDGLQITATPGYQHHDGEFVATHL
jgi:hypothetical protein